MPSKERISMTIDGELLARIDRVCEARGEPRSAFIERQLRVGVKDEEEIVRDMENPVFRAVAKAFLSQPALAKALAGVAGEHLTAEQISTFQEKFPEQVERGKQRQAEKKQGRKKGPAEA